MWTTEVLCEQEKGSSKHTFLTITLSNVVIGSYDISGSAEEPDATDRVTLKFTKIEFLYTPLNPDGTPGGNFTSTWDLSLNSA